MATAWNRYTVHATAEYGVTWRAAAWEELVPDDFSSHVMASEHARARFPGADRVEIRITLPGAPWLDEG